MMILGERLKFYRKQKKLTQLEVSEALEVSRQAISKWEMGTDIPSTKNLIALSKLFQVPLDVLVNEDAEAVAEEPKEDTRETQEEPAEKPQEKKAFPSVLILALCALIAAVAACIGIYVMNGKLDNLMPDDNVIPVEEMDRREVDPSSTFVSGTLRPLDP